MKTSLNPFVELEDAMEMEGSSESPGEVVEIGPIQLRLALVQSVDEIRRS